MRLLALAVCLCMPLAQAQTPLDKLVASKNLEGGWQQTREPKTYNKDNVFDLIDGEAELYFPYGFQRVAALDYAQPGDDNSAMAAEVYEMGSLLDAFGVYSNFRDTNSKLTELGAEGYLGGTQAMFYQDCYFVKVRAQKPSAKPEDVAACAKAISAALPQNKNKPQELAFIDIPGVVPQTTRYIGQSVLGYDFFPRGFLAQVKVNEKPARVFVVIPKAEQKPADILAAYEKYLKENGAEPARPDENTIVAKDPLHKGTIAKISGAHLIGITELDDPQQGAAFLKALEEKNK